MYRRSITRLSRTAIVIAIDSSVSMQEWTMFYNTRMRKMDVASLIANFAIDELVTRSTRTGNIRDYYDIAVLRYSGDGIEPILADENNGMIHINSLYDKFPQPISYNIEQENEDGTRCTIPITLHEWATPKAYGTAPMYETLVHIKSLVMRWCNDSINRRNFPPMVINITDGCCSDADDAELIDIATEIQSLETRDGATLLLNIYLANEEDNTASVILPSMLEDVCGDDHDCELLYNMSSTLPEDLEYMMRNIDGGASKRPHKCFARNAAICEILTLTDIGTVRCNKDIREEQ